MKILPVILAGGTGSRLWPLSRALCPKQFLSLNDKRSMLQETLKRLEGLEHIPPYIICNEEHRFIVAEQLRELNASHSGILLEPVGRNTAPAVALAALQASDKYDDNLLLLVLAADHSIEDTDSFRKSINRAIPLAEQGKLVTFGIVPSKVETGYGYIKKGDCIDCRNEYLGFTVDSFIEKPDFETAKKYTESSDYLWNSGMFLFNAKRYLNELNVFRPDILQACKKALECTDSDRDFVRLKVDAFEACPAESIDYAVMENTQQAAVVPMEAGWSDVGSWSALWDITHKNVDNNAIKGDVIAVESNNCYLHSDNKLLATVGVSNLIVVETKDAILVADKDQVQNVKLVVDQLSKSERSEHILHREVYRPWGKYDSIDSGKRDHVKRITVNPGEKLSIQMHHHRSEHWIVVAGTAKVTNGDKTFLVSEDESTYIPLGTIHALENPGRIPLEMIEVQTGSYLSEDDIVRFEDRYGRS